MMILSLTLGWILLGCACVTGWRSAVIERKLRNEEVAPVRANSWPRQSLLSYRTAGWPLLATLRRRVTAIYAMAIVGALLVMYGCPAR